MLTSTRWKELITKFNETRSAPLFVRWQTSPAGPGIDYSLNCASFELLAFDAGALAFPSSRDPVRAWLGELRRTGTTDPRIAGPEILPDGTQKFYQLGSIGDAWQASLNLCQAFAVEALKSERLQTANPSVSPPPKFKSSGRPKGLIQIDGNVVKRIRDEKSQPEFARGILSVDVLQTAENHGLATPATIRKINKRAKALGCAISIPIPSKKPAAENRKN